MGKVQREKVVVEARDYNFEQRYEQAMSDFEDKKVISVSVISSKHEGDSVREEYIVFFEDLPEEIEKEEIEAGDLVYWRDGNTGAKVYETVEKVSFENWVNKCYFLETKDSDGGFMETNEVTLVAKKKDRKDI